MTSPPARTLLDVVAQSAGELIVDGDQLHGAQLIDGAGRAAACLHHYGIGRDDSVLLIDDAAGADLLFSLLGAWWVGARPVIVASGTSDADVEDVARQTGASLVVRTSPSQSGGRIVSNADLHQHDKSTLPPACRTEDIALEITTSGTTGPAKCVGYTHRALHRNAQAISDRLGLGSDDVLYAPLPLSVPGVIGMVLLPGLCANSSVHLGRLTGSKLARAQQQLRVIQPTLLHGVPYVYDYLSRQRRPVRCERLRWAICSSAPLPPETFDKAWNSLGTPPRSSYCLAEAATVTLNTSDDPEILRTTVGRPLDGIELRLEPTGSAGDGSGSERRIVVGGESCAAGYRRDGKLFPFPNGLVRTRDLGHMAGANLTVRGRMDDVIQVAGQNVDLAHIRRVLRDCPGLGEFTVVAEVSQDIGTVPVVIAAADSLTATAEQVIAFCRGPLQSVEVPREVRPVAEIPGSANRKLELGRGGQP